MRAIMRRPSSRRSANPWLCSIPNYESRRPTGRSSRPSKPHPRESLKRSVYEAGGGQFDFPKLHDLLDRVAQGATGIEDVEIERDFERIGRRTMLLNARRIEEEAQTGLILLALEDITERKRAAEARYRRLFEAAKDGMLIADAGYGRNHGCQPIP